eukprot:gene3815-4072_t
MEHAVPYSLSNRSAAASRRAADDGEQQAPAEWGDKPVAREKRQYYETYARADVTQSIINLTTCVLGAGALGYPFCFKECGLALATIIMFVTLVATRVSYQLLLYCAQLSCRRTYEGIAEHALGKAGRQLLEVCIAALSLGALVAFLDILADVLSAVAGTIIPPGAEPSRHAYITGVTLAGALPVCLVVRDHALIAAMSNASVLFVVIFALAVFFSAFAPYVTALVGSAADATVAVAVGGNPAAIASQMAASSLGPPVLHMWHLQGALVSLPVMAYGFTAHQYYMGIYTMLKAPSVRKMKLITDMALVICAGVYWTIGASYVLTASQHALVVVMVLGVGLACALWLPNVELIFGLTGSTASVLVAFIIPALCFIKLYHAAPEFGGALDGGTGVWGWIDLLCCCGGISSLLQQLRGSSFMPPVSSLLGGGSGGSNGSSGFTQYSSQAAKGQVLVVPELRAQWLCRRRLAVGLLVFGIISGLLCTDAILGSISEEKAVVQLAQELAAHEAVVVETNRAQQKAKEAQAAVEAVNTAAQQLSTVSNTNSTLGTLAAAAAALSTISNASSHGADGSGSHPVWDLKSRLEERKQKAAEDSVLRNVEAALAAAQADIMATVGSVTQGSGAAAAAGGQGGGTGGVDSSGAASVASRPAVVAAAAPSTPSSSGGRTGGGSSSSSSELGYERANEMAHELSKALGVFGQSAAGANLTATAGKSLEQVRDSAVSALTALNITSNVLSQVKSAVVAARRTQKRDSQIKELVVSAMQRALNATAASALAMTITGDALSAAARGSTTQGSSGDSSDDNTSTSGKPASAADSSSGKASDVAGAVAALSNQEAVKVRAVIEHLASALSGTAGGSSSSSLAGGGSAGGGSSNSSAAPAAKIAELAAAIQDAVVATEGSKTAVLKLIQDDLGQTNPKKPTDLHVAGPTVTVAADGSLEQQPQGVEGPVVRLQPAVDQGSSPSADDATMASPA